MFKGFDLKLNLKEDAVFEKYYLIGKTLYKESEDHVAKTLKSFVYPDNSLDGSKMQEVWFPQMHYDVFISHSHKNKKLALFLAGYLFKKFKIRSFIDSCLWGYSKNLLQDLNNTYSWIEPNKSTYSYDKVNFSSSHVNMMLSVALTMMIDKTECLMFLNTPDSIKSFGEADKTESPWIYFEIATSKSIKKNIPFRLQNLNESEVRMFSHKDQEDLIIKYTLDLNHLSKLNHEMVFDIWGKKKYASKEDALNELYKL